MKELDLCLGIWVKQNIHGLKDFEVDELEQMVDEVNTHLQLGKS